MNSNRPNFLTRALRIGLVSACVSAGISACGGAGTATDAERSNRDTPAALHGAEPFTTRSTISTLLADDGSVMPSAPQTVPADAAARTRAGRYASSMQAEQLERALGDGVIRVDVECCGLEGLDQAIGIAHGVQAARDLPDSTPVLVRAADLRLGAVAANRLSDAGYVNVWLVTR